MRDNSASLLIGTLADQVLDEVESGTLTTRGRDAAERLEHLIRLAIAFQSGELSEVKPDADVSAAAAHSLLTTAAFQLGKLREGLTGLDNYRAQLEAFREGHLSAQGRADLAPLLQTLGVWSADAAEARVPAFFPEEKDSRRRAWIRP